MEKKSKAPWIFLIVGILLLIGGTAWGIVRTVDQVSTLLPQETWVAGEPKTVTLESGDWAIYEVASSPGTSGFSSEFGTELGSDFGSDLSEVGPTVDPESISVTGPDGQPILTRCISCAGQHQTTSSGAEQFLGVVEFTAPRAGQYTITVESAGNTVAVGKPVTEAIGSIFGGLMLGIGLAGLGMMLIIAAIIWFIVRAVSGRNVAVPAGASPPGVSAAGSQTPRGWYPDTANPEQLRWWDGNQWTQNVRPRD
jgi:hypothetical protein